jgi:hypothetical protein
MQIKPWRVYSSCICESWKYADSLDSAVRLPHRLTAKNNTRVPGSAQLSIQPQNMQPPGCAVLAPPDATERWMWLATWLANIRTDPSSIP